jgi:hypothetical protein
MVFLELNSTSKEQLAWVIKILASNKLYAPDLESGAGVDGELSSWLSNMLANGERKEANKFSAGSHMVGYSSPFFFFGLGRIMKINDILRNENGYKVSPLFAPVLDKGAEAQVEALLERIEEWYPPPLLCTISSLQFFPFFLFECKTDKNFQNPFNLGLVRLRTFKIFSLV